MATFKELGDKCEPNLGLLLNFKIGKTGQTVKERFDEEYSGTYTSFEVVANSEDKTVIDQFEEYMILRFMDYPNCDNENICGSKMIDSENYIVYLVYNET